MDEERERAAVVSPTTKAGAVGWLEVSRARRGTTGLLVAYSVMVDGVEVGKVKRGESHVVGVAPGCHEVYAAVAWARSPSVTVDAVPGQTTRLVCWPKFQAWQWRAALANSTEEIVLLRDSETLERNEATAKPLGSDTTTDHVHGGDGEVERTVTPQIPVWPAWFWVGKQGISLLGLVLAVFWAVLEIRKDRPIGVTYAFVCAAYCGFSHLRAKRDAARPPGVPVEYRRYQVYGVLGGWAVVGGMVVVLALLGVAHIGVVLGTALLIGAAISAGWMAHDISSR
jgi:hypothetical protein